MTLMKSDCTPSFLSCFIVVFNASLFIVLFGKFYIESYTKKEKRRIEKDNQKFDKIKNNDEIRNNCNEDDSLKLSYNGTGSNQLTNKNH